MILQQILSLSAVIFKRFSINILTQKILSVSIVVLRLSSGLCECEYIYMKRFGTFVKPPYVLKVMDLQDLICTVPHLECLEELGRMDFHHAFNFLFIQYSFILMVIHLLRDKQHNKLHLQRATMACYNLQFVV